MKQFRPVWWFLLLGVLAGCSGLKTYPNDLEKNLTIRTTLAGTLFSSVKAYLHVYDPKDECKIRYVGSLTLKNGEEEVGVAAGRPVCLDFVFHADAHLHNRGIVTLRPGVRYVAVVRYVNRIYSVSIRELGSTGLPGREIPLQGITCVPLKIVGLSEPQRS